MDWIRGGRISSRLCFNIVLRLRKHCSWGKECCALRLWWVRVQSSGMILWYLEPETKPILVRFSAYKNPHRDDGIISFPSEALRRNDFDHSVGWMNLGVVQTEDESSKNRLGFKCQSWATERTRNSRGKSKNERCSVKMRHLITMMMPLLKLPTTTDAIEKMSTISETSMLSGILCLKFSFGSEHMMHSNTSNICRLNCFVVGCPFSFKQR